MAEYAVEGPEMLAGRDGDSMIQQQLAQHFPNGATKDEIRDFLQQMVRSSDEHPTKLRLPCLAPFTGRSTSATVTNPLRRPNASNMLMAILRRISRHARTHGCTHARARARARARVHARTHACTCARACTHAHMHARTPNCTHARARARARARTNKFA